MKPRLFVQSALLLSALAAGCSSSSSEPIADPLSTAKNKYLPVNERQRAIDQLWQDTGHGDLRTTTRESLKNLYWSPSNGAPVRNYAIDKLLEDPADVDSADVRKSLRLMLYTEKDGEVIRHITDVAVVRGWKDYTPALVRQYAKTDRSVEEDKRFERVALMALSPGLSIEQIAFDVFATPTSAEGIESEHLQKCRDAGWEVLGRIDPTGSRRLQMLAALPAGAGDASVQDVQACVRDFKCTPLTASQLQWLRRMRTPGDQAKAAWWSAAATAISRLTPEQTDKLLLRHVEPIRWSSVHQPEWLGQNRQQLLDALAARLRERDQYGRSGAYADGNETLAYQGEKMLWGDLLAVMVVDYALQSTKGLGDVAWKQAERDMKDTSTEYGGLLAATDALGGDPIATGAFTLAIYPPRATQRFSDTRFVASDDMLSQGAVALAHYHFHAQKVDNAEYAGPGPGDMEYAQDQGVTCLVLTPVKEGVLDADVYMAGGIRLDLGGFKR